MWWRRSYEALFTCSSDDEQPASKYIEVMVDCIRDWIRKKGLLLSVTPLTIGRQILKYIAMRTRLFAHEIYGPRMVTHVPVGWTAEMQQIWEEWLAMEFTLDGWHAHVLKPTFGSGSLTHPWEVDGWREEVFYFASVWILRNLDKFEEIDPRPRPEIDATSGTGNGSGGGDPRDAKIDPYLLEHGGRKGRRLRGGHVAGVSADDV